ncbi:insulinase family protein [Desulfocurvus sp. DL9XJH121]
MREMHGFVLAEERDIPEIGCRARLWRHRATGAELMSLACDDENKVFGAAFRTPPADSTGVPHILEHSVLCGSDKYPVKEPFVELLKGSLQTFLNAFTYPDKTCYPVASANLSDFRNLVDVYLDAVFHPLIPETVFQQEGWHFELDGPDGPLTRKGVVFNEMKGAYSSPDGVLHERSQRELFPDVTYGLDSGGDPRVIPSLTYEAFKAFHETYYHPSNARFWFYGDDPEEDRLRILEEALAGYEALDVDSEVGLQPAWSEPRRAEHSFAGGEDGRAMFTVNWLLPETTDRELALALEIMEEALIGLPSSPLRRALMESGLGEDLAGVGLENELRQQFFSLGLKGVDPEDLERAEALLHETLARVAREGFGADMVEAALNSVEFDLRENNTGRFPRGLSLMLESLTSWLYGGDPFGPLAFEAPLAALKARLAAGEPVLSDLVAAHLVDNAHRVSVVLTPDANLAARREAEEGEALTALLAGMDQAQRDEVARRAEALRRIQEAPDALEAVATIPQLGIADLPGGERRIPSRTGEARALVHDIPTRGVVYVDAGFDLSVVPDDLLPLVPLFGRALFETGTSREDFADLSMRIARKTGGLEHETFTSASLGGGPAVEQLLLRGKAMAANAGEMLDILRDVLLDARITDRERFRQILSEEKARLEQRLIPAGHMLVLSRLRARSGGAGWAAECMGGVRALAALRELAALAEKDWDAVAACLETLRGLVVRRGGLVLNLTADPGDCATVERLFPAFAGALPDAAAPAASRVPQGLPRAEGLTLPAQVNYVGKTVDLAAAGYAFSGAHLAAVKHARMGYLWDHVRVRGGAYGAFCVLDRFAGTLSLVSYRDPAVTGTLEAFDGLGPYLAGLDMPASELEKSVVGAVGDVDPYLLPDAQGYTALLRGLTGDTDEVRAAMRAQLLDAGLADFRNLGALMEPLLPSGDVVVLGSAEALDKAGLECTRTRVL